MQEDLGLGPHKIVHGADVLDCKGRGDGFALGPMGVSFREDEAIPEAAGEELTPAARLGEVVAVGMENVHQSPLVGHEQKTTVQAFTKVDQAFVRDGPKPWNRDAATRMAEKDGCPDEGALYMSEAAMMRAR